MSINHKVLRERKERKGEAGLEPAALRILRPGPNQLSYSSRMRHHIL